MFFSIIELLYFVFIESKFRDLDLSYIKGLIGIFLGYYNYLEFNVHLWYLPFFFAVVFIYNLLSQKINQKYLNSIMILMGLVYPLIYIPNIPFSLNRFDLLLFFALGNIVANTKSLNKQYGKNKYSILSLFIMFILFLSLCFFIKIEFISYIFGIIGIVLFTGISKIIQEKDIILKKIGKISLVVLCIHGPIYRVLLKLFSILVKLNVDDIRTNALLTLVVTIITLIICYLVYIVFDKNVPVLIGKRNNNK